MKKTTLFSLLCISLFSLNVYALEGHGFRVISESIESSPGASGGFKPSATGVSKKSPLVAFVTSQAYDAEGRMDSNVVLRGHHSFNVSNYTKVNQLYTYKYELSCDGQYFRKTDRIEVRPGGTASDMSDSYLSVYHRQPGFFRIISLTDVAGESSNSHVATGTLRVNK